MPPLRPVNGNVQRSPPRLPRNDTPPPLCLPLLLPGTWPPQLLQPPTPRSGGAGMVSANCQGGPLTSQAATPLPRASTVKPFAGAVAALPEAAGLPYDESYYYLCLLRRSIVYGPTLGLPTVGGGGGRGGSMMSNTGALSRAAAGGALSSCSSAVFGRG
jgi:hypothetical protein